MKKFLAVLFCALILMSALPVFASAADVPVAASVNTADSGSTDITGILSSLGELFTGSTDISALLTSFGELFSKFFGTLGDIIDWKSVGSSLWSFLKNMFTDVSTTIQFFFAELYNG